MKFNNIFTQYDECIEKTLEIDPIGLSVIWTHFGQEIFKNKISSVALDLRSFNINLFNHFVIKNLINNSSLAVQSLFDNDMQEAVEKLTIILENMLIWSWKENQQEWGESKKGLLGTSKAISKWEDDDINLNVKSKIDKLELLKRQKTLGVNGRYKGSFVNIGFFTSNYNIDTYFEKDFNLIKSIVDNNINLSKLYKALIEFFQKEQLNVADISDELTGLFTNVFKDVEELSIETKSFWLKNLDFEIDDAKIIYDDLDINKELTPSYVYNIFYNSNKKDSSPKLELILDLEPKLSYIDAVLNYLLFLDGKRIDEISGSVYFNNINQLSFYKEIDEIKISCGAKERLTKLDKINSIETLINYHVNIMESRGHSPWITLNDGVINTNIKKTNEKKDIEKKLKLPFDQMPWIHDYYISSVFNIKKGLES